jgi:hypothetical protein
MDKSARAISPYRSEDHPAFGTQEIESLAYHRYTRPRKMVKDSERLVSNADS